MKKLFFYNINLLLSCLLMWNRHTVGKSNVINNVCMNSCTITSNAWIKVFWIFFHSAVFYSMSAVLGLGRVKTRPEIWSEIRVFLENYIRVIFWRTGATRRNISIDTNDPATSAKIQENVRKSQCSKNSIPGIIRSQKVK